MHNLFMKMLLMAAVAMLPAWASAAKFKIEDGPELDIWGFAQIVAESVDKDTNDDLNFRTDRVRFGTKMKWGNWFGQFQFDARNTEGTNDKRSTAGEGTIGDGTFVRDVVAGYRFSDAFKVSAGQFKAPMGMAFTMSGTKLPLMRRTMSSRLTLDRVLGVMLSGSYIGGSKEIGGFRYDLGLFNPAGRAQPYTDTDLNARGDDLSYVARIGYDYGKTLHIQAAYGEIEDAGGEDVFRCAMDGPELRAAFGNAACPDDPAGQMVTPMDVGQDSEDYEVFDIGAMYKQGPVRIRAEYIDGENSEGIDGYDEQSWYIEGGYKFTDIVEGVVRYQDSECDDCKGVDGDDRELSRTEIGLNLFFGQNRKNGRVQLYAANVGKDEEDYNGNAGDGDNKYDMVGAQLQLSF